jgi:hypothetical protein
MSSPIACLGTSTYLLAEVLLDQGDTTRRVK